MRQIHITRSPADPSHFTVLVRGVPKSTEESLSETVRHFFTRYHGPSYLSHQMVFRVGKIQKLMVSNSIACYYCLECRFYLKRLGVLLHHVQQYFTLIVL